MLRCIGNFLLVTYTFPSSITDLQNNFYNTDLWLLHSIANVDLQQSVDFCVHHIHALLVLVLVGQLQVLPGQYLVRNLEMQEV